MKTYTICGSMRFAEAMMETALELELYHHMNVLQCVYNVRAVPVTETELSALGAAHRKKIDLSDAIYVMDVDGYIGEAVRAEIAYAKEKGIEVLYHSAFRKKQG